MGIDNELKVTGIECERIIARRAGDDDAVKAFEEEGMPRPRVS
jgi:hypothetical protein